MTFSAAQSRLRSTAKPDAGQANYNDSRCNHAARDVWEPRAVHVAIRSGIIELRRVRGGDRMWRPITSPSAVTDRYATWPAVDHAADGLRKG